MSINGAIFMNCSLTELRNKDFGLLGRRDDCVIPWEQISLIGEDTILVGGEGEFRPKRRKKPHFFKKF